MYYLRRGNEGIVINDNGKELILNIGVKHYLNNLCMNNLSTFNGRKKAASKLLNENSNIPIYVDNSVFMYPTKSLRDYTTIFINYYSVLSIRKVDSKNTRLIFDNLDELIVDVSIKKIMKQHQRIEKIIEYFENNI